MSILTTSSNMGAARGAKWHHDWSLDWYQVKAADGSMQPPRTKVEQLARADLHRKWDHIARLRGALTQLAQNEELPRDDYPKHCFGGSGRNWCKSGKRSRMANSLR